MLCASTAHQGVNRSLCWRRRNNHPIVRLFFFPFMQMLGGFVAQLEVLRSLCSWQQLSLCTCAASRTGKFHPLTLGLYVSITESECTSFAASLRNSLREGEKIVFPHIKRGLNEASEPQSQQVTSPQGGRKTFLGFLSIGAKKFTSSNSSISAGRVIG